MGPGEFAPDAPGAAGELLAPSAGLLRQAYSLALVDDGYLSRASSAWFTSHAGGIPAGFRPAEAAPTTKVHTIGNHTVAVVFFPEIPVGLAAPEPLQVRKTVEEGLRAQRAHALVIGVSPWGALAERQHLQELGSAFDILLGGGPGVPLEGSVDATASGLFWSRADIRGRSLNLMELGVWPSRAQPHNWLVGLNITVRQVVLNEAVPSDDAVKAVTDGIPDTR